MSCAYCKNITVCAICGKGYAEAVRSSTRVTIAPMGMSFDAQGKLQQGEHGTKTPPRNCEHRITPDPKSGIQFCAKCGMDERKVRQASKPDELAELIEAVDTLLETAPCDCSDKRRYEDGEHLSGCYLFDLNIARGRMLTPAPSYYCPKCGYHGPVQVGHQRPNGSGECDYIAPRARGVLPTAQGHEWSALAAAENALNAIDQQIDLTKYWHAPDNTLLDLTREALRLCKKARAASGVSPLDGQTFCTKDAHKDQP